MRSLYAVIAICLVTISWPHGAPAAEALVAAASNFAEVLEQLEPEFEASSGHTLTVVTGSTGKLYAQIRNGAPFDAFLAADDARPRLLELEKVAVPGSRFTYAIGRLVLWSSSAGLVAEDGKATLSSGHFRHLAMANPALAPYGAAARQTLDSLGLYAPLSQRIVVGENIGQTFAMVATGNAELGFVALSQLKSPRNPTGGSHWMVPQALHAQIRQDAVLLQRGSDNAAAIAFLKWLRGAEAAPLLERFGYHAE